MQKLEIPAIFFNEGAIVDIEYPYEESCKRKLRPAVIIEVINNKFTLVMLKITSAKKYNDIVKYPYAVRIQDIVIAGLSKESWVLTDKELVVNGNTKLYLKGHLSEIDLETVKLVHKAAEVNNSIIQLNYNS